MKIQMKAAEPYVAIGRGLLEIADGSKEPVVVEQDLWSKAYVIPARGAVPYILSNENSVAIPTFSIASNPTIKNDEDDSLLLRGIERAYDSLARQEDCEIFKVINAAVETAHNVTAPCIEDVELCLWEAIALVREHDLNINAIVMHTYMLEALRAVMCASLEKDCVFNWIWGGEYRVLTSTMCPKNAIYVTANPDTLGVFVVEEEANDVDMSESPLIRESQLHPDKKGSVVSEKIGICVRNDYALSRVIITNNRLVPPTAEKGGVAKIKHYPPLDIAGLDESDAEEINIEEIKLSSNPDFRL